MNTNATTHTDFIWSFTWEASPPWIAIAFLGIVVAFFLYKVFWKKRKNSNSDTAMKEPSQTDTLPPDSK
jgi:hypothetical protein